MQVTGRQAGRQEGSLERAKNAAERDATACLEKEHC
jgi:hypothetical protein